MVSGRRRSWLCFQANKRRPLDLARFWCTVSKTSMAKQGLRLVTACVLLGWKLSATRCHADLVNCTYHFNPTTLNQLVEGHSRNITITITNCSLTENANFSVALSDDNVAESPKSLQYEANANGTTFAINGISVGFSTLSMRDHNDLTVATYFIGVIRQPVIWDSIFNYSLMVIIAINSLCFGVALNLDTVKKDIKRPLAVLLGLGAQFILMPLLGFGLTRVFDLNTRSGQALAIGVYATSVAPGGGASNIWCLLLDADADLSIVVTFIGSILCLGFIPLWFYTLGTLLVPSGMIVIPFLAILQAVALATVPIIIGLPIRRYAPKAASVILKILPPFCFIIILLLIATGTYANLYTFYLLAREPLMTTCAVVLPYGGLIIGALLGLAARLSMMRVKTLGIEVMVKNINIATLILRYSLEQPWADYSSAVPLSLGNLAMIPTIIALIAKGICVCKRRRNEALKHNVPAGSGDGGGAPYGSANAGYRGSDVDLPAVGGTYKRRETPVPC